MWAVSVHATPTAITMKELLLAAKSAHSAFIAVKDILPFVILVYSTYVTMVMSKLFLASFTGVVKIPVVLVSLSAHAEHAKELRWCLSVHQVALFLVVAVSTGKELSVAARICQLYIRSVMLASKHSLVVASLLGRTPHGSFLRFQDRSLVQDMRRRVLDSIKHTLLPHLGRGDHGRRGIGRPELKRHVQRCESSQFLFLARLFEMKKGANLKRMFSAANAQEEKAIEVEEDDPPPSEKSAKRVKLSPTDRPKASGSKKETASDQTLWADK